MTMHVRNVRMFAQGLRISNLLTLYDGLSQLCRRMLSRAVELQTHYYTQSSLSKIASIGKGIGELYRRKRRNTVRIPSLL